MIRQKKSNNINPFCITCSKFKNDDYIKIKRKKDG